MASDWLYISRRRGEPRVPQAPAPRNMPDAFGQRCAIATVRHRCEARLEECSTRRLRYARHSPAAAGWASRLASEPHSAKPQITPKRFSTSTGAGRLDWQDHGHRRRSTGEQRFAILLAAASISPAHRRIWDLFVANWERDRKFADVTPPALVRRESAAFSPWSENLTRRHGLARRLQRSRTGWTEWEYPQVGPVLPTSSSSWLRDLRSSKAFNARRRTHRPEAARARSEERGHCTLPAIQAPWHSWAN